MGTAMHEYLSSCKGFPPLPSRFRWHATVETKLESTITRDYITREMHTVEVPTIFIRISIWDSEKEVSFDTVMYEEAQAIKYPPSIESEISKAAVFAYNNMFPKPDHSVLDRIKYLHLEHKFDS